MPVRTLVLVLASVGVKKSSPTVQLQFSTRVETTAHQLNATEGYPPYKRYFTVYFDFVVSAPVTCMICTPRSTAFFRVYIFNIDGARGMPP
eukprot:scaffold2499_cov129-Isochrysis_galbana.AAC.4